MSKFLKEIKLNNFRAYYDATFNFSINSDKKLNVVFGTNDDGKTTFLNGLRYALYGEEEVSESKHMGDNKTEISNLYHPKENTKVTLNLVDESTKKITRIVRRDNELSVYVGQENREGTKDIAMLLPLAVKDLFIFEGEKSKNQITGSLKETIEEVSGLTDLLTAIEILSNLKDKYLSQEKKLNYKNGEKQKVIEEVQKHTKQMEKIKGEIKLNKSKKETYNKELGEVNERLRQNNESIVRGLQKNKETYEGRVKDTEEALRIKKEDIINLYVENISNWMIHGCIEKYDTLLKDLLEKGLLPTPFDTKEIKKLINGKKGKRTCICGNCIGKKEIEELNKIIEKNKKAPQDSEQLPYVRASANLEKEDFKKLKDKLDNSLKIFAAEETKLATYQKELGIVQKSLDGLRGEDIERDVALQADLEYMLKTLDTNIARDSESLLVEDSLKKINENKLDSYPTTSKEEEEIKKAKVKATYCIKKLEQIYENFMEKMKKEMLFKIKKIFKKIFSKTEKGKYFDFDLGNGFELEVKTPEGRIMPIGLLGTGVKKSMGISTALALSEIYGFEFPMILDAPFTELDRPQKKELLDVLIEISKKQQVIMLILKEDLNDSDIFPILKKNASTLNKISNMGNKNIKVEEVK